jgi:AraC family transcriptional regulator
VHARADTKMLSHALDDRRLQRVLRFVDDNLQNSIRLKDLAAAAHLSPFHFSRAFRAATGLSPHRFLRERRIEKAKELIVQGTISLAEIALICNFSSQASFTRAFTRVMGLPPGKYRSDQEMRRKKR